MDLFLDRIALSVLSILLIVVQTILGMTRAWPVNRHNFKKGWYPNDEPPQWVIDDQNFEYWERSFFCEHLYSFEEHEWFCQPANGISSYAFIIPAVYAAYTSTPKFTKLFIVECLFIAGNVWNTFGNIAYHGFCAYYGLELDKSGFTWLLANLATLSIYCVVMKYRSFRITSVLRFAVLYFSVVIFMAMVGEAYAINAFGFGSEGILGMIGFYGGIILLSSLLIIFWNRSYKSFSDFWFNNWTALVALLCVIVGFTCWLLQENAGYCWERSWFQFHACWHVMMALSALFYYIFLHREFVATDIKYGATVEEIDKLISTTHSIHQFQ